ncbi:uncharacterized protein LOC125040563 isoform X1 [Penaeus chinensis]|uniref:uncharacterized protein LOC125040563 isoform X1 n=1 Tax=Penaeus chinensis TaxID=139456 RepID=UPI001FB7A7B5|nr:uncharacterized protein LOC125040563 isoform X1 [Penaeus chinensis]XP_047491126.1 uncharacterized protein LOC125040563 isoform X1 [Penaeus chinensis]
MGKNHTIELIWLFTDQFFASFQGFFVATLYCLLNAEVRSELRKIWHHWRMKQEGEKSMIFHSAFSQSRTYFSRGTGMPCLANAAHRKKDGGNPPTGSPPGLLTNATKVNGAPVQPSFLASHRNSSCDDLPDQQSLTMSLAVVELQQRRRDDDDDDDDDEELTEATTAAETNWYPAPAEASGDLECALILQPLSHSAHEPPPEAAAAAPALDAAEDMGSDSGLGELPPPSSILYHTADSCEGSPLLAAGPRLAESAF